MAIAAYVVWTLATLTFVISAPLSWDYGWKLGMIALEVGSIIPCNVFAAFLQVQFIVVFRFVLASLYEGLSVCPLVCNPFFFSKRKRAFSTSIDG